MVLGAGLTFFAGSRLSSSASAQGPAQGVTENGILVIPIQLERDSYGLAMVDTVGQTLWIYEINKHGPSHNRLKLLAARSWGAERAGKREAARSGSGCFGNGRGRQQIVIFYVYDKVVEIFKVFWQM
jgi:hypothetical protein